MRHREAVLLEKDPYWYKDAVIYEMHVRTFHDSDGDGIGDFQGLTSKLDYIQDLGVTAIWLLPFYPSPLKDDGYDIADYYNIHPDYGTLQDFRVFLREAHRRGLRVITELVLNHTSDQHPWFQRARRAKPGSRWRDYYIWSDTPDRFRDARIIFKDFETSNWAWDPVAQAYYWHRFYANQPDLNYDNPHVRNEIKKVASYWLKMGVDGLRLDAVPYLYEREGTDCENLPESHAFLKELRSYLDASYPYRLLLAEANQWPEDARAYFGNGDECHMSFHFPVMPRLFMGLQMEDRFPIVDIILQTPAIPESCQWAVFLRNHDELTLEMVTDEERDYMYRVYAHDPKARLNLGIRRRLAPLLGNDRRKIELLNALLCSLPGTPIIYSGDEIGMGDNYYLGDRNGVRTPMQWSSDRNAGFSRANPQRIYLSPIVDPEYHYAAVNVEAQQANPHSLLWWTKRLIALRNRFRAFGRGSLELLYPENHRILAFVRRYEDQAILVVANLSRFAQPVELDLSAYAGCTPRELFGYTDFPLIRQGQPYPLTLGPNAFYWISLLPPKKPDAVAQLQPASGRVPELTVPERWQQAIEGTSRPTLAEVLPEHLPRRRWFGGKARRIKAARISGHIPLQSLPCTSIDLVQVEYLDGEPESYVLPLRFGKGEATERLLQESPQAVLARLRTQGDGEGGMLYDPSVEPDFWAQVLHAIMRHRHFRNGPFELAAAPTRSFPRPAPAPEELQPSLVRVEQSNTSVVYGQHFIIKLFRRFEPGANPDLELGRFLTERGFPNIPPVLGSVELRLPRQEPSTLAILQRYVPNRGDAWTYAIESLGRFFEQVLARPSRPQECEAREPRTLLQLAAEPVPPLAMELADTFLADVWLLGRRTGELHAALASNEEDPAFAPEPMTVLSQRSTYQSMRSMAARVFPLLRRRLAHLPEASQEQARRVVELEGEVQRMFAVLLHGRIDAQRIRCHGDFHLGQVLYTGKDFVFIDFEGEPLRPIGERRIKRSPLRDVSGMLRSFHYAAFAGLQGQGGAGLIRPEDRARLVPWLRSWYRWVAATYLRSYLESAEGAGFLPCRRRDLEVLLNAFLLDKAIYELGYELEHRPDWVKIPLTGIQDIVEGRI